MIKNRIHRNIYINLYKRYEVLSVRYHKLYDRYLYFFDYFGGNSSNIADSNNIHNFRLEKCFYNLTRKIDNVGIEMSKIRVVINIDKLFMYSKIDKYGTRILLKRRAYLSKI